VVNNIGKNHQVTKEILLTKRNGFSGQMRI
jgi:hypothetical protein